MLFFIPVMTTWKLNPIFNFKRRLIKKALRVSLPVIPHYYATYLLNSSDRVVMERQHVATTEIGRYSLAYNFGMYIETMANAINQAVGPNLLELIRKEKWKDYQRLIFAFQALVLAVCFTLSLWAVQWIPLIIRNPELQNIHILLIVIIMSYSYRPTYIGCNQVLFYYEKTNILWRITFVAGIANLIGNIIFIPVYGVVAAAVITFISLMYMGFAGFFFQVVKSYNKAELKPVMWFVLIIASLVLALSFYDAQVWVKFSLNCMVFAVLLLLQMRRTRQPEG
jgi:O-antigen/teichoic acid export membrane protein